MIDIGGGSTELVVGEHTDVLLARSLKVGAIRLTDRFFPGGEIHAKAVGECRTYVRSFLAPAVADVRGLAPFTAVGSSGTILNLARIVAAQDSDASSVTSGATFTADGLRKAVATILERKHAADRAGIAGLDDERRDIIVGGAILLAEIVDLLSIERIVVSEAALREGILVDRVAARNGAEVIHRLSDIRRRSVMRMAETFHENLDHIGRATDLSLQLFDGLLSVHRSDRGRPRPARSRRRAAQRGSLRLACRPPPPLVLRDPQHRSAGGLHRPRGGADRPDRTLPPQERAEAQAPGVRVAVAGRSAAGAAAGRDVAGGDRARPHSAGRGRHADRPAADRTATGDRHRRARCAPDADVSLERYTAEQRITLLEAALDLPVSLHFAAAPSLSAETADSLP